MIDDFVVLNDLELNPSLPGGYEDPGSKWNIEAEMLDELDREASRALLAELSAPPSDYCTVCKRGGWGSEIKCKMPQPDGSICPGYFERNLDRAI